MGTLVCGDDDACGHRSCVGGAPWTARWVERSGRPPGGTVHSEHLCMGPARGLQPCPCRSRWGCCLTVCGGCGARGTPCKRRGSSVVGTVVYRAGAWTSRRERAARHAVGRVGVRAVLPAVVIA